MQYNPIKSQTTNILANLQKKISKYLSPQYEASDVFNKSKVITKNHEQIIQNNKDFLKRNQSQEFIKTEIQNPGNQFDQLLNRRKKCQAKLNSMLLDHHVSESLIFSQKKITAQKSSSRNNCQDLFSVSSLKQVKSQVLLPASTEPNFLRIEKELEKMRKKIQKLTKKANKKGSSKKLTSIKEITRQSKVSQFSNYKNLKENNKMSRKQLSGSMSRLTLKNVSPSVVKKASSVQIKKRVLQGNNSKGQRQNSEYNAKKQKAIKSSADQTSLFAELTYQNGKVHELKEVGSSKLKKVGFNKFNYTSKNKIEITKINKQCQKKKNLIQIPSRKQKKNHIKINLLQCLSEHVL